MIANDEIMTDSFFAAVEDYLFLRNRGYPEKPSVKLVGDRYRLSGLQRKILFRGIAPTENAQKRKARLISDLEQVKGKTLHIDGYNVLQTIMNYREGKPLFICNDGLLRDIGDYGETIAGESFKTATQLMVSFLRQIEVERAVVYFDEPVIGSAGHEDYLRKEMEKQCLRGEVHRVSSVDEELIRVFKTKKGEIIGTTDSEIIEAVSSKTIDLAHIILQHKYTLSVPTLSHQL